MRRRRRRGRSGPRRGRRRASRRRTRARRRTRRRRRSRRRASRRRRRARRRTRRRRRRTRRRRRRMIGTTVIRGSIRTKGNSGEPTSYNRRADMIDGFCICRTCSSYPERSGFDGLTPAFRV